MTITNVINVLVCHTDSKFVVKVDTALIATAANELDQVKLFYSCVDPLYCNNTSCAYQSSIASMLAWKSCAKTVLWPKKTYPTLISGLSDLKLTDALA